MRAFPLMAALAITPVFSPTAAQAADEAELRALREQINQMQAQYEQRIQALEAKLLQTPPNHSVHPADLQQANAGQTGGGNFNPNVSLIVSGLYGNTSQNPATRRLNGWRLPTDLAGELAPKRGFSLGESELGFSANVDHLFSGQLRLAFDADNQVATEEAFIQTTALPQGLTLKAGRWYSGIGYLNEQHAHEWDFVDNPLAYQVFLGRQFKNDGVQVRWLAPTDTYLELGAEIGRGSQYPGTDRNKNGAGASAVFAHMGGDVGASHSWRAGLSMLAAAPRDRLWNEWDASGAELTHRFSGTSRLLVADGVWKWAPNGNASATSFTLQGEYLRRTEKGDVAYDIASASASPTLSHLSSIQSGWYVQGVYQFAPAWRVGLRTDRLNVGQPTTGINTSHLLQTQGNPTKNSVMLDFRASEFSKVRLQLARDRSQSGPADTQVFLQYQMSLGAHGAHRF